jgi:ER degradation enhancer, mannosidase alpha-like 1
MVRSEWHLTVFGPASILIPLLSRLETVASIGAGSDSFYEYLLKSYILFGEPEHYMRFANVYSAVVKHMRKDHWYYGVDYMTGAKSHIHIDSLQVFWPGMQVLAGNLEEAIESHARFYAVWKGCAAITMCGYGYSLFFAY